MAKRTPLISYSAEFAHIWHKDFPLPGGDVNAIDSYLADKNIARFSLKRTIETPVKIGNVTFQNLKEMHSVSVYPEGVVYSLAHAEKHFSQTHARLLKKYKERIEDETDFPVAVVKDRKGDLNLFFENSMTAAKNADGKWQLRDYRREFGRNPVTTLSRSWLDRLKAVFH